jgi:hypothetical protein
MKPAVTKAELGVGSPNLGVKQRVEQKRTKVEGLAWQRRDLNPRPGAYESPALPPELRCPGII